MNNETRVLDELSEAFTRRINEEPEDDVEADRIYELNEFKKQLKRAKI